MAIEDSKKKRKTINNRNQRVTGGQATGGGASVNNAGNTGVLGPPSQRKPEGIIDSAKGAINRSFLGDIQRSGERDIQRAGIDPVQLTKDRGFLGAPVEATRQFLQVGATDAIERGVGLAKTGAKKFGEASRFLFGEGQTPQVSTDPAAPIDSAVQQTSFDATNTVINQDRVTPTLPPADTINTPALQPTETLNARLGDSGNVQFGGDGVRGSGSVDFGSPEANAAAAKRFQTGTTRGSFNVLPKDGIKNIRESNRLTNARSAVAKLKAGGASATAQLEAFKRISKGGQVDRRAELNTQFQNAVSRGDELGAREISRSIDRFDTAEQARKASNARIESDRQQLGANAAKTQDTLSTEGVKFDKETNNLLRDLVKVDQISGKSVFDLATRSDQVTRRLGDVDISSNLFQSIFPDFFKDGVTKASLDAFRANPSISDSLKLKARDALIAQQTRR